LLQPGTFKATDDTLEAAAICQPVAVCSEFQFVQASASAVSDTDCRNGFVERIFFNRRSSFTLVPGSAEEQAFGSQAIEAIVSATTLTYGVLVFVFLRLSCQSWR